MSSTRFDPPVPKFEEVSSDGSTSPDRDGYLEPGENDYARFTNKRTLRSYISSLTRGKVPAEGIVEYNGPIPTHANAYSIGDGRTAPDEAFLISDGAEANRGYSNSGLFDGREGVNLDSIVNKGKSGKGNGKETLSGHLLLRGIKGPGDEGAGSEGGRAYKQAVSEILQEENIDNPNGGFDISKGRIAIGDGNSGLGKSPNSSSAKIDIVDLKNVAIDIMLAATGKEPSLGPDGNIVTNAGAEASTGFKPSLVQVGTSRVPVEELRAAGAEGIEQYNLTTSGDANPLPTDDGVGETIYTNASYGSVYSPLERFGTATTSFTSFSALAGMALGASLAISAINFIPGTKARNVPVYSRLTGSQERYLELGKFEFANDSNPLQEVLGTAGIEFNLYDVFNVYKPTNQSQDYGVCVILGFASLIGANYDELRAGPVAAQIALRLASLAISSEKGYYISLFREVMKQAGNLLRSIPTDPASLFTTGVISIFTNSKIFKFVDTLAKIGDLILLQDSAKENYKFNDPQSENAYKDGYNIDLDLARNFAAQRIRGSRFGSARGSGYGVSQIPSAHLIPAQYTNILGDPKLSSFLPTSGSSGRTNLRLSKDDVIKVENMLEAEYMPFYFHDLRTNEIVAFHAFLEDLSDSYSAEYNASSGYGRIESVRTYKETKRSVGCTFQLVSTNKDDFDYMWWQINKLTTMVYPQWSKGRELQTTLGELNQEFKFTQPFSQIPTATPIIRFRLGDLIRSNYSKFNLKRLFGYNSDSGSGISDNLFEIEPGNYEPLTSTSPDERVTVENTFTVSGKLFVDPNGYCIVTTPSGSPIKVKRNSIKPSGKNLSDNQATDIFYDSEKNSIIRSFESSMGLGLAAVVTQLQFTWLDSKDLWGVGEDGSGYRAPRSCKVQMSFEPIHDIAPGIDHQGLNRAPIYPVGSLVGRLTEGGDNDAFGKGRVKYRPPK